MSWSSLENTNLLKHYPNTPELCGVDWTLTDYFNSKTKHKQPVENDAKSIHIVLIKGLMGDHMLNHFKSVKVYFEEQGYEVSVAPTSGIAGVQDNASAIASHLALINKDTYLLCHSKGGLDALTALDNHQQIWPLIRGVVLVQTPYGISPVLNSILTGGYPRSTITTLKDWLFKVSITLISAKDGCYDLINPNINAYLKYYRFPFPVVQFATWSIQPTSWVDSFHKRLNEIDAGVAHDGQFYVHKMLWPCFPNILVGGIDHAQPVVGGYGFRPGYFWEQCLNTLKSIAKPT